ncbi:MAG TPA: hypothetical protein VGG84_10515 [Gemmatimonadaceae bacterium]|jgi:hypothetical protein
MRKGTVRRSIGVAAALAVAALLQGCAVTTGRYIPDRSSVASHSMLSRFDARFQQIQSYSTPATGSALHIPQQPTHSQYLFTY